MALWWEWFRCVQALRAASNFSVDGAGVSGIIDSIGSSGGEQYGPGLGPESGLLPSLTVCVP